MREDCYNILTYLDENDEAILQLRDWVRSLDSSQPESLDDALDDLHNLTQQISTNSHDFLGYYYLFLGCVLYEKGEYENVIKEIGGVHYHLSESSINRSLIFWLLGLSHLKLHNRLEAHKILQSASDLLSQNTRVRGEYQHKQAFSSKPIKEKIDKLITDSQNEIYLFSDIIYWLEIPQDDDGAWRKWQDAICSIDADTPYWHIEEQIGILTDFIEAQQPNQFIETGYIYLFLAECYRLENLAKKQLSITLASKNALAAVEQFRMHRFNQAIASWYVAALYRKAANATETKKYSEKARDLFKAIIADINKENPDLRQRAAEAKKDFERWLDGIQAPQKNAHIIGSFFASKKDKNTITANATAKSQRDSEPKLTTKGFAPKKLSASESVDNKKSDIRHIVIPIDISALREKAYQARLLDRELFKNLEDYNRFSLLGDTEQKVNVPSKSEKQLIIPSFPIYGQVSAGTNGESMLIPDHALGTSSQVYDDMICNIEDKTYKIQFIPPFAGDFLTHKKYGWLKVKGQSMNKARPLSINPDDYILFCENHNIETCVNKIIIAQAPEVEGYPFKIMVKRLLRYQTNIFGANLYKFWLHSESSLKNDPVTHDSYEKDVEIEQEYQITGEVLAVASEIK